MCAIFGAVAREYDSEIIDAVKAGLSILNHRGAESAGVVYNNGRKGYCHKGSGTVPQVLNDDAIEEMRRRKAILLAGQTLYSTSIGRSSSNTPPQYHHTKSKGQYGLVHNGNIPNLDNKKKALVIESNGAVGFDDDDYEVANDTKYMLYKLLWLIEEKHKWDNIEGIRDFMLSTRGAYSSALVCGLGIYLFRDPWGNRPLMYTETSRGIFFSSEDCALKAVCGPCDIKEVLPGQIVFLSVGAKIERTVRAQVLVNHAYCSFENVYFSMPDSRIFLKDVTVGEFRRRLGKELARQAPVPCADIITDIPNSGTQAGQGFAMESGIPFVSAYVKDGNIGRTFINPSSKLRQHLAKIKCRLDEDAVRGKKVVVVDDSIVRGNTIEGRVSEMKEADAREVHVRSSYPLITSPCYYGIDMPTKEELIANHFDAEGIRKKIGADSLYFNTIDSLNRIIDECGGIHENSCKACCDGVYPIPLD